MIRHAVTAQVDCDDAETGVGKLCDDVAVFKPTTKGPVQQHDQRVGTGTGADGVQTEAVGMNVSVLEWAIQLDDGW